MDEACRDEAREAYLGVKMRSKATGRSREARHVGPERPDFFLGMTEEE